MLNCRYTNANEYNCFSFTLLDNPKTTKTKSMEKEAQRMRNTCRKFYILQWNAYGFFLFFLFNFFFLSFNGRLIKQNIEKILVKKKKLIF